MSFFSAKSTFDKKRLLDSPVNQTLENIQLQNADIFESGSFSSSPISSPAYRISEIRKDFQQKLEMVKKENSSLLNDLEAERDKRYHLEQANQELEAKQFQTNQSLLKYKDEAKSLRTDNMECNRLSEEHNALLKKYLDLQEKCKNLEQRYDGSITQQKIIEGQKEELEEEFSKCKTENFRYKSVISNLESDIEYYRNTCAQMELKVLQQEEQIQALNEELKDMKMFKEDLDKSTSVADVLNTTPGECMSIVAEMKISELNEQISEMTRSWLSPSSAESLKRKCEDLQNELELYKEQIHNFENVQRSLEEKNSSLLKQVEKSSRDVIDRDEEIDLHRSQIDLLKIELDSVGSELSSISAKLDQVADIHQNIKDENAALKISNDETKSDFNQTKERLKQLTTDQEQLKAQHEKASAENLSLSSQLDQVKSDLSKEEERLKKITAEKDELANNHQKALEDKLSLSSQIEKISFDLDEAKEKLEEETTKKMQLSSKYQTIVDEKLLLSSQIDQVKSDLSKYEERLKKITAEKDELANNCQKALEDKLSLSSQIDQVKSDLSKEEERLKKIRAEKDELANKYQKTLDDKLSLSSQIEKMLFEFNEAKEKLNEETTSKLQLSSKYRKTLDDNLTLSSEIDETKSDLKQAKERLSELTTHQEQLASQHEKTLAVNLSLSSQIDLLKSELLEAKMNIRTYQQLLDNGGAGGGAKSHPINEKASGNKNIKKLSQSSFACDSTPAGRESFISIKHEAGMQLSDASTRQSNRPSLLGFSPVEEPDLSRSWRSLTTDCVADLQSRNSAQFSARNDPKNLNRKFDGGLPLVDDSTLTNQKNLFSIETSLLGGRETSVSFKRNSGIQQPTSKPSQESSTAEEPDVPKNWKSLSLARVAELQSRNSRQLAHLKSSYPTETQGTTPSRCDETVRVGDPRKTLLRLRHMQSASNIDRESLKETTNHPTSRKREGDQELLFGRPPKLQLVDGGDTTSSKPAKPSTAFEIPFTPPPRKTAKRK